MIVFYHLSKTGGVSILRSAQSTLSGTKRVFLREMPQWLDCLQAGRPELDGVSFLSGHFAYGIEDYLTDRPLAFTILRNPIEQTLSMYHTAMNVEGKPERIGVYPRGELPELLTTPLGRPYFNNPQVRHLAGEKGRPIMGEVTERHLERALDVVANRMTAFGISEYPRASLDLINSALGTSFDVRFDNVSPRPPSSTASGALLHLIWTANRLDRCLYERGLGMFFERVCSHERTTRVMTRPEPYASPLPTT